MKSSEAFLIATVIFIIGIAVAIVSIIKQIMTLL